MRKYHRRSSVLYVIYGVVMFIIIIISILQPRGQDYPHKQTVSLIVGLSCFVTLLLSPLGLFWSIKAFTQKEGTMVFRVLHVVPHLIMLGLLIYFLQMLFGKFAAI